MRGLVIILLLAGVMLCLGIFLSLPASATDLPSAYVGAVAAQEVVEGGVNAPSPDGSYPITPAEELQETDKRPISAHLLTMAVLVIVPFGASLLWMLTSKALRQGAIGFSGVLRASSTTAREEPSFLAVFLL
jgi:hypothetical protein